ncbi:hypothetical protein BD414DRAFT_473371 [Trametes punicea]|nr:hypothetical protein BD414DRAFT_473371 [Trametes punicea]
MRSIFSPNLQRPYTTSHFDMASGVRRRKSPSVPELDVSNLNNVERLIFAQAVHEFGADAWPEVAKLLSNHPLISQPKGTFTLHSCPILHRRLMEEAGLECLYDLLILKVFEPDAQQKNI